MLDQIIQDVLSQGWSYQKSILSSHELKDIGAYFKDHAPEFSPAKVGGDDKDLRPEIRGDFTLWLNPLDPPAPFLKIFQCLNSMKIRLNRELLLGVQDFECHLAYYPVGTFYKKHLDRHQKSSHRVFSFIFYLHPEWNEDDGGELALFDKNQSLIGKIHPEPGSMLCFLSEDFPHEVLPAKKVRQTLTGWMHNNKILF